MRVFGLSAICFIATGCMERLVPAPVPVEDGSFYVHVVRQPDETFPKILTWYTGTTLSGSLVVRFNPYLQQRDVKIGDRVVIPVEVMANEQHYGTAPVLRQTGTPNLLMGDDKAPSTGPKKSPETFDDETNPTITVTPDAPDAVTQASDQRRKDLEREIREKQAELERLKQPTITPREEANDELPYEGGESF